MYALAPSFASAMRILRSTIPANTYYLCHRMLMMYRNDSDDKSFDTRTRRDERPCSRRVHNSGTVLHGVPVWLGILRLVSIELAQLFRIFLLVGRSVRRLSSLASVSPLPFHLGRNARARHRPFPRATNPAFPFQVGRISGMRSNRACTVNTRGRMLKHSVASLRCVLVY